jgi:peptide/nickel transport system substrate-binding protein
MKSRLLISSLRLYLGGMAFFLALTGCRPQPSPLPEPPLTVSPTLPAQPTSTPTLEPEPSLLTVCLGQEPSPFLYLDNSSAARAVRQAIYDGPIDRFNDVLQPVILQEIPSLAKGTARLDPLPVSAGDVIVDANGELAALDLGVRYRPAGCQEDGCALVFGGEQGVQMDQLVVRFQLVDGLSWSDGQPLTAGDSVFAYRVAQDLFPRLQADLLRRTLFYNALDARTVEWKGLPGYLEPQYPTIFFSPLPEHALAGIPAADLPTATTLEQATLGWGPYVVKEWIAGDHITLSRNPLYWRAAQGLPALETLVFRFVGSPQAALDALLAGECDIVDESANLETSLQEALRLRDAGQMQAAISPRGGWEQVLVGIAPADPARPALFASREMRQALALCMDRQRVIFEVLFGQTTVMNSYVTPGNALENLEAAVYGYNPQAGAALLEAAGWMDADNNPATPRQSRSVAGLADGSELRARLLVAENGERQQAAAFLVESLAGCGVAVELQVIPGAELLAPGPQGAVFGRNFDLALFGWAQSVEPPCGLYLSDQIPGPQQPSSSGWGGANAAGYRSDAFDAACRQARLNLVDSPGYLQAQREAQAVFAQDLPAIPLYTRLRVTASRLEVCGLQVDASAASPLWNLEDIVVSDTCGE